MPASLTREIGTLSTRVILAPPPAQQPVQRQWLIYGGALAYAVLIAAAIGRHEPWADEAQAWLLGRDASLADLWLKLLHYEGSPGLWQTLLHALIRLGLPYSTLNYLGGLLGLSAAWLALRYAPFPLPVRLALPFTFFLGYQYAVIARSYDLLPVLLFACAMVYANALRRPWLLSGLLCLMAMVSVHGLILSGCIAVSLVAGQWKLVTGISWRKIAFPLLTYLAVVALACASAYPAHDVTFVTHPKLSLDNWFTYSTYTLREAFTGEGYSTIAVIALSIPFLWRGRGLLMFGLSALLLCTFGAVVYGAVWHQGLLFLSWLFAIWIAAGRQKLTRMALAALAIVLAVHCYWTVSTVRYDWNHSYSAGREAARFLQKANIAPERVYSVGYAATAIQPYFAPGRLARGPAYWDWSIRNSLNDASYLLSARRREYVMVGYKLPEHREYWEHFLSKVGYRRIQHFEGNLFWHTRIFESESFDLYRATGEGIPADTTAIAMNDETAAAQLVAGFYDVEQNTWRWTSRSFSVALKAPEGSEQNGARLSLRLFIPDGHIRQLGPITLRADAGGEALPARTFSKPGEYEYSAEIPPGCAGEDHPVYVNFHLDKAIPAGLLDGRELGVVVTRVGLR